MIMMKKFESNVSKRVEHGDDAEVTMVMIVMDPPAQPQTDFALSGLAFAGNLYAVSLGPKPFTRANP